ncbi:hypothetical protein [Phyllobacterium sp. CL33Tsu]|uniref:hypothetical protein n=1 Tax=Phyllobacterium sp. CL33Tsu TaxID=1798191 RepID=UPI000B84F074|nr:hypothetical protein [Phyllobacterium sp. CL33Tsu]
MNLPAVFFMVCMSLFSMGAQAQSSCFHEDELRSKAIFMERITVHVIRKTCERNFENLKPEIEAAFVAFANTFDRVLQEDKARAQVASDRVQGQLGAEVWEREFLNNRTHEVEKFSEKLCGDTMEGYAVLARAFQTHPERIRTILLQDLENYRGWLPACKTKEGSIVGPYSCGEDPKTGEFDCGPEWGRQ